MVIPLNSLPFTCYLLTIIVANLLLVERRVVTLGRKCEGMSVFVLSKKNYWRRRLKRKKSPRSPMLPTGTRRTSGA